MRWETMKCGEISAVHFGPQTSVGSRNEGFVFFARREREIVFSTEKPIAPSRIKSMLSHLFGAVYPKAVPFNFDGFHTARGNAAGGLTDIYERAHN